MSRNQLSSFFRSSIKTSKISKSSSSAPSPSSRRLGDSIFGSPAEADPSYVTPVFFGTNGEPTAKTNRSLLKRTGDLTISALKLDVARHSGEARVSDDHQLSTELPRDMSAMLESSSSSSDDRNNSAKEIFDMNWLASSANPNSHASEFRKELSRERKLKWVFNTAQVRRFDKLVAMCSQKLGAERTIPLFQLWGRETGLKEYNALIGVCIQKARDSDDEAVALEQIHQAFQLFELMKERGFQLEKVTYDPVLMYLIDMSMVEEFYFFVDYIKDENAKSISRLGYYEMLFCIRTNDGVKIRDLCDHATSDDGEDKTDLIGNYLLALSESGREEVQLIFKIIDIKRISSLDLQKNIFMWLGRQQLESFAEKFLLTLKSGDIESDLSGFISDYAVSLPNLVVKDVICKYKNLHEKLEVMPSSSSYQKLISYCCTLQKVYTALDLVDEMCEAGLDLLPSVIQALLRTADESGQFNVVHRIYSVIRHHNVRLDAEVFRAMISLAIKLKDFTFAYDLIKDLLELKLRPTASMFNTIMAGYFREGNTPSALSVLKEMEAENVKPDTQTYCCLISNSKSEDDIVKELKEANVHLTKHVYMSLINAYTKCSQFEKAKQVVAEKGMPIKSENEIKSALVSALAINRQMRDALDIFDEVKRNGGNVEPRAVLNIIESFQSDGELKRLLQLLKELEGSDYWKEGCARVVALHFRQKHLSVVIELIKQFANNVKYDESAIRAILDEVFALIPHEEPSFLQIGLDLLQVIKNDFGLLPSRRVLDFLLSACVNAKDHNNALLVWKEYQSIGFPYNVLTYVRMYQAHLACGKPNAAKTILKKIPQDDPHIRLIVKEYKRIYVKSASRSTKRKEKKKKRRNEVRSIIFSAAKQE